MEDYDRRQLESMLAQFQAYQLGKIDLPWLISSLESLLGCLESLPEAWREEFRDHWGVLEEVYSVAIVREQPVESLENKKLIDSSIGSMRSLLRAVIGSEAD